MSASGGPVHAGPPAGPPRPGGVAGGLPRRRRPRPIWRIVVGICFILQLGALPFVMFWFIGGDPYPVSRAGVTMRAGQLHIVNVSCAGERLRGIELRRQAGPDDPGALVWAVSGDVRLPALVGVGDDIPRLSTTTPLREPLAPADRLSLEVTTTLLDDPYALDFTVRDVPTSGILSYDGRYGSIGEFRAGALEDAPCEGRDPLPSLLVAMSIQGGAALLGIGLVAWPGRRRRVVR